MAPRLALLAIAAAACSDPEPAPPESPDERSISGTVTGLVGTIRLTNYGIPIAEISQNGRFTASETFREGTPYALAVPVEPTGYGCVIENANGSFGADDVTDVRIICRPDPHLVGGLVTGLHGELTLLNNEDDELVLNADGGGDETPFVFEVPIGFSADYDVTVAIQPKGQICAVSDGGGTVGDGDIDSVRISCRTYDIVLTEIHARPITGLRGDANGDGVRDSGDDEFVEILSREDVPVPVGGWVITTGSTSQVRQFEFPDDTILPPRARVVVFGGDTPTGSFGPSLVYVTSGLSLTDAPSAAFQVLLQAEQGGLTLDRFEYVAATFADSASQVRQDEAAATPTWISHVVASGQPGILWSPGVPSVEAIPKLNPAIGFPADGASLVSVLAELRLQFNMFILGASLPEIRLYQSTCDALTGEVAGVATAFAGDDSNVVLVPPPLAYDQDYCLLVTTEVLSVGSTPLAAAETRSFHTRGQVSLPATTVVLSELGGCRFSSGTAGSCTGAAQSDEYIELHNPTGSPISLSGWFLQRRTAAGTASCYATLPATAIIPAGGYYLVAGFGYNPANYPGAPTANHTSASAGTSTMTGADESILLLDASGTCTGSTGVVDSVTYGDAVNSDSSPNLRLPKLAQDIPNANALERKACWDSTGENDATTGMGGAPGHSLLGNRERIGASNADWVPRSSMNPQNADSAAEVGACP